MILSGFRSIFWPFLAKLMVIYASICMIILPWWPKISFFNIIWWDQWVGVHLDHQNLEKLISGKIGPAISALQPRGGLRPIWIQSIFNFKCFWRSRITFQWLEMFHNGPFSHFKIGLFFTFWAPTGKLSKVATVSVVVIYNLNGVPLG